MDAPLFTRVRWREGYDMAQVDAFLERLLATVEGRYVERPSFSAGFGEPKTPFRAGSAPQLGIARSGGEEGRSVQ